MRSGARIGLLAPLVLSALAVAPSAALAQPAGGAGAGAPAAATARRARPLAVSVSPDPTPVTPGAEATVPFRVLNPGSSPLTVTVVGRALRFGDNGRVTIGTEPDPAWVGLVAFPSGPLTIPAGGYTDTSATVRVPAQISPDLYFVGFVVTPAPDAAAGLAIVNQIGGFLTLDVPGPRQRLMAANLRGDGFVLGSSSRMVVQVRNVGHAQVRFWGESDTTSSPGGSRPAQRRMEKSLLPVGAARLFSVRGHPAWPVGFVTVKVRLFYPKATETATQEIVVTRRALVVNPLLPGAVALVAGAGAGAAWSVRRRRRRRAKV